MSYEYGTIYKVICLTNPEVLPYIGSTFNDLTKRWQYHREDYHKHLQGKCHNVSIYPYFTQYGIENFQIVKIKDYLVYRADELDRKHLSIYEQLWMNKIKNCNKYRSFNIKYLADRELHEKYKIECPEKKVERDKLYREKNRDKIRSKGLTKYDCECGSVQLSYSNKSHHNKSLKHQQYLSSLEIEIEIT